MTGKDDPLHTRLPSRLDSGKPVLPAFFYLHFAFLSFTHFFMALILVFSPIFLFFFFYFSLAFFKYSSQLLLLLPEQLLLLALNDLQLLPANEAGHAYRLLLHSISLSPRLTSSRRTRNLCQVPSANWRTLETQRAQRADRVAALPEK